MPYVKVGTENGTDISIHYEDHGHGQPVVLTAHRGQPPLSACPRSSRTCAATTTLAWQPFSRRMGHGAASRVLPYASGSVIPPETSSPSWCGGLGSPAGQQPQCLGGR